jgi:hypothetical protein
MPRSDISSVILRRKLKGRACLTSNDRWFFVQLYRWFPSILSVVMIIRPETLVRWHRAGFRRYWRWKSCRREGRPPIEAELRALTGAFTKTLSVVKPTRPVRSLAMFHNIRSA